VKGAYVHHQEQKSDDSERYLLFGSPRLDTQSSLTEAETPSGYTESMEILGNHALHQSKNPGLNASSSSTENTGNKPQKNYIFHTTDSFRAKDPVDMGKAHEVSQKSELLDPFSRDWNTELLEILEIEEQINKANRLSSLAKDFVSTAESYAKMIIREKFLPNSEKKIKPIDVGMTFSRNF
jgi:hypothetical protein